MPIYVTKDGRRILDGKDYSDFRCEVYRDQDGQCMECGRSTCLKAHILMDHSFHLAHRGSRGMGSAIRDDVLGPKRGQVEGGKCGRCHRQEHHQQ